MSCLKTEVPEKETGLQPGTFSLCLHMEEREKQGAREREIWREKGGRTCSPVSLPIRALIPSDQGPTSMTTSNPNHLLKATVPSTITLGIRLQHIKFVCGWQGRAQTFSP